MKNSSILSAFWLTLSSSVAQAHPGHPAANSPAHPDSHPFWQDTSMLLVLIISAAVVWLGLRLLNAVRDGKERD